MNKQYFENEEEAMEIYLEFKVNCNSQTSCRCSCADCWVEYAKENDYIKKSGLEIAKEEYISLPKTYYMRYIHELEKEIERLKK